VNNFSTALKKAAKDTAAYMTMDVRNSARSHGWASHEASALRVRYHDGEFHVHAEGDHAEDALTREFGTEEMRPTAVMRKYQNNPGNAEEVFMQRLNKHLGGQL
jgi:hypothetical protein